MRLGSKIAVKRVTSAVVASALILLIGCGDSPLSPSEVGAPLSATLETEHFVFRFATGDSVETEWQEIFHDWATRELGVSSPRIQYNKYLNRSHIYEATGSAGNAWADPASFSIHTIWPRDNHEVVHLYASLYGSPVALFSEGFAVAHQVDPSAGDFVPRWSGVPVHSWARRFRRESRLIPIASLLLTSGFRSFDDGVTYPESGSFVRYLIDEHGLDRMLDLFRRGSPNQPESDIRSAFRGIYGFEIESAEERWKAFLDG
jgi:hypothetical protein